MTTLTEAQAAVLTPALARADGCIFPVTAALKGGAVGNVAKSLLKRNLIEEVPAADDAVVWRCDDAGQPLTLRITAAGARCIRGDVIHASEPQQARVETPLVVLDGSAHPRGSRQQILVALLARAEGATITELQAATGWQPHSVRGAISGVVAKKLGHTVASMKEGERGRVYRITH
jgi:hypothetical protein